MEEKAAMFANRQIFFFCIIVTVIPTLCKNLFFLGFPFWSSVETQVSPAGFPGGELKFHKLSGVVKKNSFLQNDFISHSEKDVLNIT